MNGESQIEVFLSVLVLAVSTAIATGIFNLPDDLIHSPMLKISLVVLAFFAFIIFPMVGLSLFFLLAVIFFSKNVDVALNTAKNYQDVRVFNEHYVTPELPPLPDRRSPTVETNPVTENPEILDTGDVSYGERSIPNQRIQVPNEFKTFQSDQRSFSEFNETDSNNPVLGKINEGFLPSNYNDDVGQTVEGQYPKDLARSSSNPDQRDYNFRPDQDMGSNEFVRLDGPEMDEKLAALKY